MEFRDCLVLHSYLDTKLNKCLASKLVWLCKTSDYLVAYMQPGISMS